MEFPSQITAGTSLDVRLCFTAYQPPAWTAYVALRGPSAIDITATQDGTLHRFTRAAAVTATWLPGSYLAALRVTDGTQVVEVERFELKVLADVASLSAGYEARSHVERMLAAIEAVLENRGTLEQQRYMIKGRELYRVPPSELLSLRDRYRAELRRMKAASNGTLFGGLVKVNLR